MTEIEFINDDFDRAEYFQSLVLTRATGGEIDENHYVQAAILTDRFTHDDEVVDDLLSQINSKVDQWKAQIKTAVYMDWRKEFTNTDFDNATAYGYYSHNGEQVPSIKTFALDRYTTITQELQNINFSCATSTTSTTKPASLLAVFPNPAKDKLQLKLHENLWGEQIMYQILDLNGSILETKQLIGDVISLEKLQTGLFVLKCFDENGNVATKKIMVVD